MGHKYTVSEIADYFNISAQTVRYYDRIGLLKPESTAKNSGYRTYGVEQFNKLYLIRELKQLGLSLEEIKGYCETRDVLGLSQTLEQSVENLDRQIAQLEEIRRHTQEYLGSLRMMEQARSHFCWELRSLRERYAYMLDVNFMPDKLYAYIEMLQESCCYSRLRAVEPGRVILGMRRNALESGSLRVYHSIGHMLSGPAEHPKVRVFPEGLYGVACHLGRYETIFETYRKLLRCIRQSGYQISGDSLEISVTDQAFTDDPEKYVTEIQIPVVSQV